MGMVTEVVGVGDSATGRLNGIRVSGRYSSFSFLEAFLCSFLVWTYLL